MIVSNKRFSSHLTVRKRVRGAKAFKAGLEAENIVGSFFQKQGFTILGQRVRTPFGEIDLIISNEDWLIGIEVKQRGTHYDSAFALREKQSQRLLHAFDYLIKSYPDWNRTNTRFDVALVNQAGETEIIEDALRFF